NHFRTGKGLINEIKINNPNIKRWNFNKYIPNFSIKNLKRGDILQKTDNNNKLWEFEIIQIQDNVIKTIPEIGLTFWDIDRWNKRNEKNNQELNEIKVNPPSQYNPNLEDNFKPFERGKNVKETIQNFLKANPNASGNQIVDIISFDKGYHSKSVG